MPTSTAGCGRRALNQKLKEKPEDKKLAKAVKVMEKDYLPRQKRYEEQERKLAGRSSYSKTDEDATFFRMKEDRGAEKPLPKPAYNVQLGTEGQFVVGFSLHQRAGDTTCLIPHLEGLQANLSSIARRKPELLPKEQINSYAVYPRTFLPMPVTAAKRTTFILKIITWATMSNTTPSTECLPIRRSISR
jgi:hypothetical protein